MVDRTVSYVRRMYVRELDFISSHFALGRVMTCHMHVMIVGGTFIG